MIKQLILFVVILVSIMLTMILISPVHAGAKGKAQMALLNDSDGILHLEAMIRNLKMSLKSEDTSPQMKSHIEGALKHAEEALTNYRIALEETIKVLGKKNGKGIRKMEEGSGMIEEGSGLMEEGSGMLE